MMPSASELLQIVICHWRKAATFAVATMLATWAVLAAWPRTYRSESLLLVRVGRESVALDPTTTVSQTLMLQKSQEDEVNSALNILNSYQVAAAATDAIGVERILSDGQSGGGAAASGSAAPGALATAAGWLRAQIDGAMWTARLKDPVGDRELAIARLQSSLAAFAPKQSTVITIHGTARSPELAQTIVAEVTKAFLTQRLSSSRTAGSREFFDDQVAQLGAKLEAKTAELAEFRQTHQIISIDASRAVLKEQLSRLEQEIQIVQALVQQAESERREIEGKIATVAPQIVQSKTAGADSTWSGMRQALYDLQIQEKQLSQVVTADHPKLMALREQVREAERILGAQTQESVDETTAPNPVHQRLVQQLLTVETQLVGHRSQATSLAAQRAQLSARLSDLVTNETELARLERDFELVDADYRRHANKQQEARVIAQLEADRISNVNVVQPATFVEKPISPRKKIIGVGGLAASLAGAVAVALAAEAARTTLRTSEHAEAKLGAPVLVTIPAAKALRSRADIVALDDDYAELKAGCRSLLRQVYAGYDRRRTPPQTIGVLGCSRGAGASTVASLLALAGANEFGLRTALVDADDPKPAPPRLAGRRPAPRPRRRAAEDYFDDGDDWDFATFDQPLDDEPVNPPVEPAPPSNLARGAGPEVVDAHFANPQEVIAEVRKLAGSHELVVVDLPAATAASGGAALASMLDCVVLIVEAEATDARMAQRVRAQLERSQAHVEGIVLNKVKHRFAT